MKVQKIPNVVVVLILTLVTVIMWISMTVYGAFTSKPPNIVSKEISQPLNPDIDNDTLKQIESSIFLSDFEIPDSVISTNNTVASFTPAPAPLQQETSSPSAASLP